LVLYINKSYYSQKSPRITSIATEFYIDHQSFIFYLCESV